MKEKQHVLLFEIKRSRIATWKKWCKLLNSTYRSELLKSFKDEAIEHEMFVSFELNGKTYGIVYIEGEKQFPQTKREVNNIHERKVRESLNRISQANILYNVKNSNLL